MNFKKGIDIQALTHPLGFEYGHNVFGPEVELRYLNDIRQNLMDPNCDGPEIVYAIAMDVGMEVDKENIIDRNLLFGVVTYAKGTLGKEPVRSQGHIHAISPSCGMSTCEVYEIWQGEAYIYMQETAFDNPGKCYAVHAKTGDVVIVPPGWAHATIVADVTQNLTFGAWCVRDFGFDYVDVRKHKGLAWYPVVKENHIEFKRNMHYLENQLIIKEPHQYDQFHIKRNQSIYQQFQKDPDKFLFVSKPQLAMDLWNNFEP